MSGRGELAAIVECQSAAIAAVTLEVEAQAKVAQAGEEDLMGPDAFVRGAHHANEVLGQVMHLITEERAPLLVGTLVRLAARLVVLTSPEGQDPNEVWQTLVREEL